jgi:HNH endonuclease
MKAYPDGEWNHGAVFVPGWGELHDPFPQPMHRKVWEDAHGDIPDGHLIHHIDGDPSNYALENLQMLTYSQHQRLHLGWEERPDGWWRPRRKREGEGPMVKHVEGK